MNDLKATRILSLEVNPSTDQFLSTSRDQTLKLWDLGSTDELPMAFLDFKSKNSVAVANFDPTGLIFAVAYTEMTQGGMVTKIRLYDVEKYEEVSPWSISIEHSPRDLS